MVKLVPGAIFLGFVGRFIVSKSGPPIVTSVTKSVTKTMGSDLHFYELSLLFG